MFDVFKLIGEKNVLYCDTDSAFFINEKGVIEKINEYNKQLRQKAIDMEAYIMFNGNRKYFGEFSDEKENIIEFKSLHSKCYMYRTDDKKLHSVIAGVISAYKDNSGVHKNTEELDDFKKFEDGFIFSERFGGTLSKYIENEPQEIVLNNHRIEISDGVIIEETTKKLSNSIEVVRNENKIYKRT